LSAGPGTGPADKPAGRFVAVLQQSASAPAFLLTVDVDAKSFTVRRVGASPEAGKSYELWLVSDRFPQPRSLGLIGADAFTPRPVLAGLDPGSVNRATDAVSLEPEGGSPTGAPTGPVLFTGSLIEATPK
jgi:anti-sigma-K factor RskA